MKRSATIMCTVLALLVVMTATVGANSTRYCANAAKCMPRDEALYPLKDFSKILNQGQQVSIHHSVTVEGTILQCTAKGACYLDREMSSTSPSGSEKTGWEKTRDVITTIVVIANWAVPNGVP